MANPKGNVERHDCTLEEVSVPGRPDITCIEWKRVTRWSWDDGGRDYQSGWETEDFDPEDVTVDIDFLGDIEDQRRIPLASLPEADQKAVLALIEAWQNENEPEAEDLTDYDPRDEEDPVERKWAQEERDRNRAYEPDPID